MSKPFLDIDNQIRKLQIERGLSFQNEEFAKVLLLRYGYYEIINGYKEHFMIDNHDDDKGFIPGTTFEHIFQLFTLDRNLRSLVMSSLETFELSLRQAVAYTVAEKISDNQADYIKREHYRIGRRQYIQSAHRYMYPVDYLLNILRGITHADTEPFNHYREVYENIPPWIIVKKLNFGNLIWWYRLLKGNEKTLVNSRLLGVDVNIVEGTPELSDAISSLLSLYLNYRNTAAHGGRIYNHYSDRYAVEYNNILHGILNVSEADYRLGKGHSHLGTVLNSLQLFQNKDPYNELRVGIGIYLRQYLKIFPKDRTYLLTKMEMTDSDIDVEKYFTHKKIEHWKQGCIRE